MITLICKNCGKEFETYQKTRKFGSRKCYNEWQHLHPNKTTFKIGHNVPQIWRDKNSEIHKGKILTKGHKEKLRKTSTGKKHKQEAKEKVSRARLERKAKLGYINSPMTRKKMSIAKLGEEPWNKNTKGICKANSGSFKEGNKPWNFNNYSALEPYGPIFNEKNKDKCRKFWLNYCQLCGVTQESIYGKLSIHHIDYNKKNNDFDNWIPLCRSCHSRTQVNRGYWVTFFQKKVALLHNNQPWI